MKRILLATLSVIALQASAQDKVMTKELLWQLGRVNPVGITEKGDFLIYKVGIPNVDKNTVEYKTYQVTVDGKRIKELENTDGLIKDRNLSPDGKFQLSVEEVKVNKVLGKDRYPELKEVECICLRWFRLPPLGQRERWIFQRCFCYELGNQRKNRFVKR